MKTHGDRTARAERLLAGLAADLLALGRASAAVLRQLAEDVHQRLDEAWFRLRFFAAERLTRGALRVHSGATLATIEDRTPPLVRARAMEIAAVAPRLARLFAPQPAGDRTGRPLPQRPGGGLLDRAIARDATRHSPESSAHMRRARDAINAASDARIPAPPLGPRPVPPALRDLPPLDRVPGFTTGFVSPTLPPSAPPASTGPLAGLRPIAAYLGQPLYPAEPDGRLLFRLARTLLQYAEAQPAGWREKVAACAFDLCISAGAGRVDAVARRALDDAGMPGAAVLPPDDAPRAHGSDDSHDADGEGVPW